MPPYRSCAKKKKQACISCLKVWTQFLFWCSLRKLYQTLTLHTRSSSFCCLYGTCWTTRWSFCFVFWMLVYPTFPIVLLFRVLASSDCAFQHDTKKKEKKEKNHSRNWGILYSSYLESDRSNSVRGIEFSSSSIIGVRSLAVVSLFAALILITHNVALMMIIIPIHDQIFGQCLYSATSQKTAYSSCVYVIKDPLPARSLWIPIVNSSWKIKPDTPRLPNSIHCFLECGIWNFIEGIVLIPMKDTIAVIKEK